MKYFNELVEIIVGLLLLLLIGIIGFIFVIAYLITMLLLIIALKLSSDLKSIIPNYVLNIFGYERLFTDETKFYTRKYDSLDLMMTRPIHKNMSVAPPWAKSIIVRKKNNGHNTMSNYCG